MGAPTSAQKRLNKEMRDLTDNPVPGVTVSFNGDDMHVWAIGMQGPASTPYANGRFALKATFPANYPFQRFELVFVTPVYHPNVDNKGGICLDCNKPDNWKPSTTLRDAVMEVLSLLTAPNLEHPLVADLADQYKNDRTRFDAKAREFTQLHAK